MPGSGKAYETFDKGCQAPVERDGETMADVVGREKATVVSTGTVRDGAEDLLDALTSASALEGRDEKKATGRGDAAGSKKPHSWEERMSEAVKGAKAREEDASADAVPAAGAGEAPNPSPAGEKRIKPVRIGEAAAGAAARLVDESDELDGLGSDAQGAYRGGKRAKGLIERISGVRARRAEAGGHLMEEPWTETPSPAPGPKKGSPLGAEKRKAAEGAGKKAGNAMGAAKGAATGDAVGSMAAAQQAAASASAAAADGAVAAGGASLAPVAAAILGILALVLALCTCGAVADDSDEDSLSLTTDMVRIAVEEYLTGDGTATEGAKYWEWTCGSSFVDGHSTPWCASFVSWCGNEAGLLEGGYTVKSAACAGWKSYYEAHKAKGEVNTVASGYEPQVGDIVIYGEDAHHIGIVAATSASDMETVEEALSAATDTETGEKRRKHLESEMAAVAANDGMYLTVEGNTSDADASSSSGNRLGVHAKSRSQMTYVCHVYAPVTGSGKFDMYELSESEVAAVASLCVSEQGGSAQGVAMEASLIANRYQYYRDTGGKKSLYAALSDSSTYVGGFFGGNLRHLSDGGDTKLARSTVRKVICEGRRALPLFVNEHDCISDLSYLSGGGSVRSKSSYTKNKTVIHNRYSSTYTFWAFSPGGDTFGYTSEFHKRYKSAGESCYSYSK